MTAEVLQKKIVLIFIMYFIIVMVFLSISTLILFYFEIYVIQILFICLVTTLYVLNS